MIYRCWMFDITVIIMYRFYGNKSYSVVNECFLKGHNSNKDYAYSQNSWTFNNRIEILQDIYWYLF